MFSENLLLLFQLYFFHVPARTDLQSTTITPAPQVPTGKTDVNKSERAPEVPAGDVKGNTGDSPKAQRLVGPDKTVDTSEKDKGIQIINNDKIGEAKKTSDVHGDVNKNNNNNIPSEEKEKAINKDTQSDTKQPENPGIPMKNLDNTNTDTGKRDAGLQPEQNEIVQSNNDEKNEGVNKRAADLRQRFLRKHSRNI